MTGSCLNHLWVKGNVAIYVLCPVPMIKASRVRIPQRSWVLGLQAISCTVLSVQMLFTVYIPSALTDQRPKPSILGE